MAKVFVIAEAGSNWHVSDDEQKNYAQALRLVGIAAGAGADACKFQVWSPGGVYVPGAGKWKGQDVNEMFDRLALPRAWIPDLAAECARFNIEFMASVFSPDDVAAVDPYVKRHKIASYELGYHALFAACCSTRKPLIFSVGAARSEEIATAMQVVSGRCRMTVMHCTAAYPAPVDSCHLATNLKLGSAGAEWGFSDHTADEGIVAACAVGRGAAAIEKHFTELRCDSGPDHAFALEPTALRSYIAAIRTAEAAMGEYEYNRPVFQIESVLRRFAVRCVVAARDLPVGTILEHADMRAMRPGNRKRGVHASKLLHDLVGRRLIRPVAAFDGITEDDLA